MGRIYICNNCGEDQSDWTYETKKRRNVEKVVIYNLANMLCFSCSAKMQDEIMDIAKKYLRERN